MDNHDYFSTFCSLLFFQLRPCSHLPDVSCFRMPYIFSWNLNLSGTTVKLCIMDSFWTLYLPIDCYCNIPSLSRLFCEYLRNACQASSETLVQKMGKSYGKGFSNESRCRIIMLAAEKLNNERVPLWFIEALRSFVILLMNLLLKCVFLWLPPPLSTHSVT